MPGIYSRWMDRWERRLATRDSNRVVRPFEWGWEWLETVPAGDPHAHMDALAAALVAGSERFYSYRTPSNFELQDGRLRFASPLCSQYHENNTVHARWFPAKGDRAMLVLPQWNADGEGHLGLCKLLNRFGISALRMTLAYHDRRMPPELERADYHVSSNVGRTIHACRQSVVDARACLDWLEGQGYGRLGILGTSLGSCIAFIVAAHDARPRVGAMNHVSTWFGDVVWAGLSTRHVRQSLGTCITREQLRRYWAVISPASFFDRMIGRDMRNLLVWTSYDTTFPPEYSREVVRAFRERRLNFRVLNLPCGHYTLGRFPFNWWDGLTVCRYVDMNL